MRFFTLFVCLAFLIATILADDVATRQTQQQQPPILDGSVDADTTYVFSDVNEDEGFYPGSVSHIVLGFKNVGQRPNGFVAITGSLYYSLDSTYVLENYTAIKYDTPIQPGEEFSFTYPFRLHPMLSEGEYGLRFTAIYRDEFNTYATTFYNATVDILEPHRDLHIQDILQSALIVGVIFLFLFAFFKSVSGSKKTKGVSKNVETPDAPSSDWLAGTGVAQHQKRATKKTN